MDDCWGNRTGMCSPCSNWFVNWLVLNAMEYFGWLCVLVFHITFFFVSFLKLVVCVCWLHKFQLAWVFEIYTYSQGLREKFFQGGTKIDAGPQN